MTIVIFFTHTNRNITNNNKRYEVLVITPLLPLLLLFRNSINWKKIMIFFRAFHLQYGKLRWNNICVCSRQNAWTKNEALNTKKSL